MLNTETVKFIAMLNELAEKSARGFVELADCTSNKDADNFVVFVDSFNKNQRGTRTCPVVSKLCILDENYVDEYYNDNVNVVVDGDSYYILVTTFDMNVRIAGGKWVVV